ncbi:hypothetical protein T4B_5572 [Trichinella pseudospiralis]|uniref:Uncharacterized protein n=2 Tax=Trichinella pseudospiralis TaxID=6337 RepID=A0A0V1HYI1_TRIPS|nr:hypothetical protein T4B_5572 [Trichinella pseudospiralis]
MCGQLVLFPCSKGSNTPPFLPQSFPILLFHPAKPCPGDFSQTHFIQARVTAVKIFFQMTLIESNNLFHTRRIHQSDTLKTHPPHQMAALFHRCKLLSTVLCPVHIEIAVTPDTQYYCTETAESSHISSYRIVYNSSLLIYRITPAYIFNKNDY